MTKTTRRRKKKKHVKRAWLSAETEGNCPGSWLLLVSALTVGIRLELGNYHIAVHGRNNYDISIFRCCRRVCVKDDKMPCGFLNLHANLLHVHVCFRGVIIWLWWRATRESQLSVYINIHIVMGVRACTCAMLYQVWRIIYAHNNVYIVANDMPVSIYAHIH